MKNNQEHSALLVPGLLSWALLAAGCATEDPILVAIGVIGFLSVFGIAGARRLIGDRLDGPGPRDPGPPRQLFRVQHAGRKRGAIARPTYSTARQLHSQSARHGAVEQRKDHRDGISADEGDLLENCSNRGRHPDRPVAAG